MFQDEPTKLHSFSVKGATTDNSIVQGLTNYSLTEQIKLFQDYLVPAPAQLPWSSNNSLFSRSFLPLCASCTNSIEQSRTLA